MPGRENKQRNKENKESKEKALPNAVTAAELTAIVRYLARHKAKPSVRFKVSKNGNDTQVEFDHPNKIVGEVLVLDALASADGDFLGGIASQLVNANRRGQDIDERGLNFMLSVIKGIEPRDQLEAMLAAQMAAVHVASMRFARELAYDTAERAFNKLTRTFAMQMEALKRYRAGAEQKVTLQHVSVTEGGQAIIGNVTHAPRKNGHEKAAQEKPATPAPALPNTNVVPMPSMGKSKEHDPLSVRRKSNK